MRKKLIAVLPFVIMPISIPLYSILDNLIFVEVFGCGCVPSTQTNILGIPFNANDLRFTVYGILAIGLSVWSIVIAKTFKKKSIRILYCFAVLAVNTLLALWVTKNFMWA